MNQSRFKRGAYTRLQGPESSDDEENIEITPPKTKKQVATMDVEIDPGDTLQAIALRYHCSLAELKRMNFIHRENEIYAKRTLKVPIVPHSLLTESITGVHISGNNSPVKIFDPNETQPLQLSEDLKDKLTRATTSNGIALYSKLVSDIDQTDSNQLSSDLQAINSLVGKNVTSNDVIATNGNLDRMNGLKGEGDSILSDIRSDQNTLWFKGDDCGMSWLFLIILTLVICVVCPLIYIFYLAEHPEIIHHHYYNHH